MQYDLIFLGASSIVPSVAVGVTVGVLGVAGVIVVVIVIIVLMKLRKKRLVIKISVRFPFLWLLAN